MKHLKLVAISMALNILSCYRIGKDFNTKEELIQEEGRNVKDPVRDFSLERLEGIAWLMAIGYQRITFKQPFEEFKAYWTFKEAFPNEPLEKFKDMRKQ